MDTTAALLALTETQHGVVSHRQARSLGMDRRSVRRLAGTRQWEAVTDEVLRRRGSPLSDGQRLASGVLDAGPTAALSHLSVASWWGLAGCPRFPTQVARTARTTRGSEIADVHTVRSLPARWLTRLDGIVVVSPELLALQLFAVCREARAERLVETLWSMRLLSGASIGALLDDLGRRGRDGTAGLRRYFDERGPGYVPTATGVEARVGQILRDAGIELRRQVDSGGERWTGRVDFGDPELPFRLEVQSERYHSALVDRRQIASASPSCAGTGSWLPK